MRSSNFVMLIHVIHSVDKETESICVDTHTGAACKTYVLYDCFTNGDSCNAGSFRLWKVALLLLIYVIPKLGMVNNSNPSAINSIMGMHACPANPITLKR